MSLEHPGHPAHRTHHTLHLLDAGLVGILFWTIDGGIVDANDTFLEMMGYTREEMETGQIDWIEMTPPELRDLDAQPIADLHELGRHLPHEKEYVRKDGTRLPILVASAFNEGSRTEGVGFVVDITAQKKAQQEARERSEEIATIFESMTEAFFALDTQWKFTYVNAQGERHLRRSRADLIGKVIWNEFPGVADTVFGQEYRRAVRDNVAVTIEDYYPPLGGWFEVRGYPARTSGGEPAGLSIYFKNVTERKEAEQERERLLSELREANIRQRRFLSEMLRGFTDGRLRLCFGREELPPLLPPLSDEVALSQTTLRLLRKRTEATGEGLQIPKERLRDFLTASHEAAMNAVQHGGGGVAHLHGDRQTGCIQTWIVDEGPGIAEEMIHRAVEQGFTTGGFGQGFYFMQSCADRFFLLTGSGGTTIVLEMERTPPEPLWLASVPG